MTKWSDTPPPLDTIMRRYVELGKGRTINIFCHEDGSILIGAQRGTGNAYGSATVAPGDSFVQKFLEAIGPGHGRSWSEYLRLDVDYEKPGRKPPPPVDDDDLSDVI